MQHHKAFQDALQIHSSTFIYHTRLSTSLWTEDGLLEFWQMDNKAVYFK